MLSVTIRLLTHFINHITKESIMTLSKLNGAKKVAQDWRLRGRCKRLFRLAQILGLVTIVNPT